MALLVHRLQQQGVLAALSEHVRFVRRRFGYYEVIDFLAVLFGYALSGERTLEAFHERVRPWASVFMALFGRDRLPSRSALSRWLTALDQNAVEALRACFLADLLGRPLGKAEHSGGLWDRAGMQWLVFDVDGTREAARQRALPQTSDRPAAQRRLRPLCAPGYLGRKRGEVIRTRTPCCTPIPTNGSARLGTPATDNTVRNCVGQWERFKATSPRMGLHQRAPCCAWMDNMAPERSSQTWPISPM